MDLQPAKMDPVSEKQQHTMAEPELPSRGRIALASAGGLGALAAFLFVPAGRLDWMAG